MTDSLHVPTLTTLPKLVEVAARHYGDKLFMQDGQTTLSFNVLNEQRQQAAKALLHHGVCHGDRVAIWAPNIHEWVIAALGVHSIGAILVPLNTRFKGNEAGDILRRSGVSLLFSISGFLDTDYPLLLSDEDLPQLKQHILLRGNSDNCVSWQDFLATAAQVDDALYQQASAKVTPQDTLDIMFTSGTTGQPKGVMTSHQQTLQVFDIWSNEVGLTADDSYLIINPFFHTFGYKAGWLSCLIRGATAFPMQTFDSDKVLTTLAQQRITVLPGPPTIYQSLLNHKDRIKYDLSALRLAVTGAASVPVQLVKEMKQILGFDIVLTAYGLTESCGVVSICNANDSLETIATTSGKAMRGVEVNCVATDGSPVTAGEAGEILVRGFNVMQGYFNDEAETAKTIDKDGWLHTGDVGILNEQGYLRITDRIKDMFICGGFNCYPAEIENRLYSLEGVAQVAVIGISDDRLGEVGKAFIVLAEGTHLDESQVIQWSRDNMANYKVPRQIEFVTTLPTNLSGKVLKNKLRQQHHKSLTE